jgi:hypothetical protein
MYWILWLRLCRVLFPFLQVGSPAVHTMPCLLQSVRGCTTKATSIWHPLMTNDARRVAFQNLSARVKNSLSQAVHLVFIKQKRTQACDRYFLTELQTRGATMLVELQRLYKYTSAPTNAAHASMRGSVVEPRTVRQLKAWDVMERAFQQQHHRRPPPSNIQ